MMKKVGVCLLALLCAGSMVGCAETTVSGDTTVIAIKNYDGGVGISWLDGAIERFETLKANEVYEEGKKGVTFAEPKNEQSAAADSMASEGYHIYFLQGVDVRGLAQKGLLMNITDIVTEDLTIYGESGSIEDKVDENYRQMLKAGDGNYYGLPHYEYYPGFSYDVEHFKNYNLYIAAEGEEDVEMHEAFGKTVAFCGDAYSAKKSCGNDGEYGTRDDGLPTSLMELLVLCDKMDSMGIYPFTLSGQYIQYSNYIVQSLWASLAGYEQMRVCYDFEGELEVITGWTNENLFEGINYIKKPIVETVRISSENNNRHLIYNQAARYYAISFLEIMEKEGWFYKDASSSAASHTTTQGNFIFNGKTINGNAIAKIGMLCEGSYWYQESVRAENFSDYKLLQGGSEKQLAWMSLPTSLDTTVAVGQGEGSTLLESGSAYAYINNNISGNAGLSRACKEFLQFLYTDAELQAFTVKSGSAKAVSYELTSENKRSMDSFPLSIWELRTSSKILYAGATNETFLRNPSSFLLRTGSVALMPVFGQSTFKNFLAPLRSGYGAKQLYEASLISETFFN